MKKQPTNKEFEALKKANDLLAAKLNQLTTPPKVQPEKSCKLKRVQLKLTWDNGQEIMTDDLGVAAAHVNKSIPTVQVYISRDGGSSKFKNPSGPGFIIIKKIKAAGPALKAGDYIFVYVDPNNYGSEHKYAGIYDVRDICKDLLHTSLQRLRRELNANSRGKTYERWGHDLEFHYVTIDEDSKLEDLSKHIQKFTAKELYEACKNDYQGKEKMVGYDNRCVL